MLSSYALAFLTNSALSSFTLALSLSKRSRIIPTFTHSSKTSSKGAVMKMMEYLTGVVDSEFPRLQITLRWLSTLFFISCIVAVTLIVVAYTQLFLAACGLAASSYIHK